MASTAQILANQSNARRSTGPRTPESKARCAQNANSHGLTARHLIVRDDETEEFETLRADLLAELTPEGAVEMLTFNELLHAAWNHRRFRRLEAERFSNNTDPVSDPAHDALLDRLVRYQSRAQRVYYRALQELRTLQTNRALRAVKLDKKDEAAVPAITDINELTKQTHSEVQKEALKLSIDMIDFEAGVMLRHARQNSGRLPSCRVPKPAA